MVTRPRMAVADVFWLPLTEVLPLGLARSTSKYGTRRVAAGTVSNVPITACAFCVVQSESNSSNAIPQRRIVSPKSSMVHPLVVQRESYDWLSSLTDGDASPPRPARPIPRPEHTHRNSDWEVRCSFSYRDKNELDSRAKNPFAT